MYQSLGEVSVQGNRLVAQYDGYSVAEVTYTVNTASWQVNNITPELTQFIIVE